MKNQKHVAVTLPVSFLVRLGAVLGCVPSVPSFPSPGLTAAWKLISKSPSCPFDVLLNIKEAPWPLCSLVSSCVKQLTFVLVESLPKVEKRNIVDNSLVQFYFFLMGDGVQDQEHLLEALRRGRYDK